MHNELTCAITYTSDPRDDFQGWGGRKEGVAHFIDLPRQAPKTLVTPLCAGCGEFRDMTIGQVVVECCDSVACKAGASAIFEFYKQDRNALPITVVTCDSVKDKRYTRT